MWRWNNEAKEGTGLMAPRVAICANHMANMALRIILGEGESKNGRYIKNRWSRIKE